MSRLRNARPAVRPAMKARLMLAGPAGSGKTKTALAIASVLAEGASICVIDTEQESALTYADDYRFIHCPWEPPYDAAELAADIVAASERHSVVIVDSASHFWRGSGGMLDLAAGKFTGWKAARPVQEDLVLALLRAPAHIIICVRSKMEYSQETEAGKQVVRKLGMAPVQDETLEYELNVSAELDMEHKLSIGKTRCSLLDGKTFHAGHEAEMATIYQEWLKGGEPVAGRDDVAALVDAMNAVVDVEGRRALKAEFVELFGRPDHLLASRLAEASAWVRAHTDEGADAAADGGPAPAATPADGPQGHDLGGTAPEPVPADEPGGVRAQTTAGAAASTPRPPYPALPTDPMSLPQQRKLHATLREIGVEQDERHNWAGAVLERPVDSLLTLTRAEARVLIDEAERVAQAQAAEVA